MNDIQEITQAVISFRDERDWKQFHNAKDLCLAINVEAGELLELFLWKDAASANDEKIKEELADILIFAFILAHEKGIDIKQTILDKLKKNGEKYPVNKAKGNAKKYNEFD